MDYTAFVQTVTILGSQASAANGYALPIDFSNIMPEIINYAEGRIYREMTFLGTRTQDSSLSFTGTTRSLNLQNMQTVVIVPEGLSLIYPVGQIPALGTRVPFLESSLDFIDLKWPQESQTQDPTVRQNGWFWAMRDNQTIVVGPTPNAAYGVEITGLFMPSPLSASNLNTYITTAYPDLMVAAGMIFVTAYMRNFGAQSDNPKMTQSWENQYQTLAASVRNEEERRRGSGQGWTNYQAAPAAEPARTG